MRRLSLAAACLALAFATACAHPKVAVAPSGPTPTERLAAADDLVRAGCLDCLITAFREYDAVRTMTVAPSRPGVPAVPPGPVAADATAGSVRAAAMIALRERELGMLDEGYLDRARAVVAGNAALQGTYGLVLDIIDTGSKRMKSANDPGAVERGRTLIANRAEWLAFLKPHADDDALFADTWVWFSCSQSTDRNAKNYDVLLTPLVRYKAAPVALYQAAVCTGTDLSRIEAIETADPRFHEMDYWRGMSDLGAISPSAVIQLATPRVDLAQEHLSSAYAWHPAWPTLMTSLGGLYMTAEAFDSALDLYDKELALLPAYPDGLLGRVEALSYLARYEDAIAAATMLLQAQAFPGEAYYWRAWNQLRVPRLEESWADVRLAERLWVNADVSKLAGIIAYQRHELEVAKGRFETAQRLNGDDCETRFNFAAVNAELGAWGAAVTAYDGTGTCLERLRTQITAQIAALDASDAAPERKARGLASRNRQLLGATRMLVQSWFNTAIADSKLDRKDDARKFAEKVMDDEQFGARAKDLLAQLSR
jgi:tetratricopeptide (TPR) repeat protein